MSICDYLHVLDFGTQIFQGTPAETRNSEIVRVAYLGSEAEPDEVPINARAERNRVS
jgi:ABC-type lipopolysaccharide export system ATPase subunit